MGQAKQWMMENEENNDLIEFLKTLDERDELSGTIAGITKQIIAKGVDSMSSKQEKAIDLFVNSYKNDHECEMCVDGNIGSLNDYIHIADEGLCPSCKYSKEKYMRD